MFTATLVMIAGIAAVAVLSQRSGYRLGGVMVVPLLVIYTFREPLSPFIFVVGALSGWASLWLVREYTLNHGRRVFLVAVVSGVLGTLLAAFVIAWYFPAQLAFANADVVASIFPGIAAYNFMRLDPDDRPTDALAMCVAFACLFGLGVAALVVLDSYPPMAPPVLALPTSDLVTWLGIRPRGSVLSRVTPGWLSVLLLIVDVVVYEWFRKRYDLRLAGIIVIPLLAVFSVRFEGAIVVFAVGATVVFALVSVIHWLTLLYGRVLLAISLVLALLYALLIGIEFTPSVPGQAVFFVGLFVGVSAYNLHRVAPKNRPANIRVSAALFVVFYAFLVAVVDIPPGGLLHSPDPVYLGVGLFTLGLAGLDMYRLERSIPDGSAFARASVFSDLDRDGATLTDSPLVSHNEGEE